MAREDDSHVGYRVGRSLGFAEGAIERMRRELTLTTAPLAVVPVLLAASGIAFSYMRRRRPAAYLAWGLGSGASYFGYFYTARREIEERIKRVDHLRFLVRLQSEENDAQVFHATMIDLDQKLSDACGDK